jgi:hypothetical protein
MDFIYITDTINFKNPVFGEGTLVKDKIYYAYTQFAQETERSGIGQMIQNKNSDIIHFEPHHLNLKERFKKILFMFAGGLGDAVTLGIVLPEVIKHYNINLDICGDKIKWDMIFKPMGIPGKHISYPPDLETLFQYDAVLTDITRFYYSNDGLRVSPIIQVCRGFGINYVDLKSIYKIPDDVRNKCKLPPGEAFRIGVNLDSNGRVKSYPEKLLGRLLKTLNGLGFEVYLLGIKKNEIEKYHSRGIYDLRSKTTIPELAAVIRQMDMVLGVDSFIIHLSNLLNKPTITLLSTTTPSYFERHKNIRCISSKMECSPCFEVFDDCPLGYNECRAFYHKSISEDVIVTEIVKRFSA